MTKLFFICAINGVTYDILNYWAAFIGKYTRKTANYYAIILQNRIKNHTVILRKTLIT